MIQYDFCYPANNILMFPVHVPLKFEHFFPLPSPPQPLGGPHNEALAHCYVQREINAIMDSREVS